MAHIEKLYDDNDNIRAFKAVVETGAGKRKRQTKTYIIAKEGSKKKAKKKAKIWKSEKIVKREKGTLVDPKKITVSQYFEQFLKNKKDDIATTTYDNYMKKYEAHIKPILGNYKMQKIKSFHLEKYFIKKKKNGKLRGKGGLSDNTLKKLYVLMNQCFRKADKFNIIERNPLEPIDCPQPKKKEAEVMKQNEFNKLLKTAKENDFFMFVFICTLLYTGMRKSEALGLTWKHINTKKGIIKIRQRLVQKRKKGRDLKKGAIIEEETKNSSSRRNIKISEKLCKLLKKYKAWQNEERLSLGEDYKGDKYKEKKIKLVFCKSDGKRFYPTSLNKKMKKIMKKAKLPYKSQIHILRHTFATINVNSKIESEIVQNMLGHSSIKTTIDIYYHHDVEQQKEAVENLDKVIDI